MIASPSLTSGPNLKTDRGDVFAAQQRARGSERSSDMAAIKDRVEHLRGLSIDYIDNDSFKRSKKDNSQDTPQLVRDVEEGRVAEIKLTSSMPAHLARLCATPLLSVEEERECFRRMNYCKSQAAELRSKLKRSLNKVEAIEDYLRRAERIRNYLVQANTRLVMSIARSFADNRNSFDDLLSQGIASLMHAVEKFDFGRGYRFSTYATCAVRRDLYRLVMGVKKDGQRYSTGTGEILSSCTDYRAEAEGISEGAWNSLSDSIGQMMEHLDDREKLIVSARFGLGDEEGKASYSKLGGRLGISKERVRQLANRALEKLRELAPEHRLESLLA